MMIIVMMDLNDDIDDCTDKDYYMNFFDDGDGTLIQNRRENSSFQRGWCSLKFPWT